MRTYQIPVLSVLSLGCTEVTLPPPESDPILGTWNITTKAGIPNPSVVTDVDFGNTFCDLVYQMDSMVIRSDLTGVLEGALLVENCFPENTMSGTEVPYTLSVSVTPVANSRYEILLGANTPTPKLLQLELSENVLSGEDETTAAWSFLRE